MGFVEISGIAGTILSFYGAYLAIEAKKQAMKAAEQALTSAQAANQAVNQISNQQKTTELATTLQECKKTAQSLGKYVIATNNKNLSGVDYNKDAEVLLHFISHFNENRATIDETTDIESELMYQNLNELLTKFTQAKSINEKISYGKQASLLINNIIFNIKKSVNERNRKINS